MILDLAAPNQIILIGPVRVGKTTIGTLLADRLQCEFTSLDMVEQSYTLPAGYDPAHYKEFEQSTVPFARYQYRRMFFEAAVTGFLADYSHGVLELGAGHPIVPDPEKQRRISEALHPYKHVVLLLPTQDLNESAKILRARRELRPEALDINDLFMKDNSFYDLAKFVVYTLGKPPEETCQDVLDALGF